MDNLKQTVNQYLDDHCNQSRPTIWGILHNTPCHNQYIAHDLYKEWVMDKYKDENNAVSESENSAETCQSETESENQEVKVQSDSE